MSKTGITQVVRDPGDPLAPTMSEEERHAVAAMTDAEVHTAAQGDPDAQPMPRDGKGLERVVNVYRLRQRLCMTQERFSTTYHIPVGTLRDWEQGRKRPDAPARAYLRVIEADPQGVARMLDAA